jgi:GH15 family glucan-1,4-alpha-glucosidase
MSVGVFTMITRWAASMARPIVLSNGELHVGLNDFGLVHDFYYPYVGLENHSAGQHMRHKIGVWIDGQISWLDDDKGWVFSFRWPHTALVGHTVAKHEKLGVILEFDDCVDSKMSAFLRNIHIVNTQSKARQIRLFMHQAFIIGDLHSNADTAQYLPDSHAILHYRGRRAFIISGQCDGEPFDQHSIGLFGLEGHEGTFRDAEDGELSGSNVEYGKVDSVLRFVLDIDANSSKRVHYWIAAGTSTRQALYVNKQIKEDGIIEHLHDTASWWEQWLQPAIGIAKKLPKQHQETFIDAVMVMKSQIDKRGAIIASTDTSMLNYSRDTYSYSWPRDGSYVIWPLIRMGYKDEAYRFFEFCKQGLHPNGYLMHKYRADGALGSSWHPYVQPDGEFSPPIQEDETATVIYVLAQFYQTHKDPTILKDFYQSMVVPMAGFLVDYIDPATHLPKPTYDLWEEVYMTTTYTTATAYGALLAASDLASAAGDEAHAVEWRSAANDIQAAAHRHLYNHERKVFYKGLNIRDGQMVKDATIDTSAIFGSHLFGLFDAESTEMTTSMETMLKVFDVTKPQMGLPRYENDNYRREDFSVTGNWWFITSLWLTQYNLANGKKEDALQQLDWIQSLALPTGLFSEQIDQKTQAQISPSPLTWSQAEYISTLLDLYSEAA